MMQLNFNLNRFLLLVFIIQVILQAALQLAQQHKDIMDMAKRHHQVRHT